MLLKFNASNETLGEFQILSSLLFFGISYISQRYAMLNEIQPMVFNAQAFFKSLLLLTLMRPTLRHFYQNELHSFNNFSLSLFSYGTLAGITLFGATTFILVAMQSISAGETAFIESMTLCLCQ